MASRDQHVCRPAARRFPSLQFGDEAAGPRPIDWKRASLSFYPSPVFDGEMSEERQLQTIARLSAVAVSLVVAVLAISWPYGHWIALVVGAVMLFLTHRALVALGSGDQGPGGGFVEQRRRDLRGRRVIFAIVLLAGIGGAITQLVRSQL